MQRLFLFIVLSITLTSCSKNNDNKPVPSPVLKVSLPVDYISDNNITDEWLFVSDKSGKLLAYNHNISGPTTFTSTSADDSVSLTFVYLTTQGNNTPGLSFTTYGGLPRGSSFDFPSPIIQQIRTVKSINISVINATLESQTHSVNVADGHQSAYLNGVPYSGPTYSTSNFNLDSDTSTVLLSGFNSSFIPVYTTISQPLTGDIEVDFSMFKPYPKTFPINIPGFLSCTLIGNYTNSNGSRKYVLDDFQISADRPYTPMFGYLDWFDNYYMSLLTIVLDNSKSYYGMYYKQGALNTSPTIPSFSTIEVNTTFDECNVSCSIPYTYKSANFTIASTGNAPTIGWLLYSPLGSYPKIVDLPSELLIAYPAVDITKLKYYSSTFIKNLDGSTYANSISNNSRNEYENYQFASIP